MLYVELASLSLPAVFWLAHRLSGSVVKFNKLPSGLVQKDETA